MLNKIFTGLLLLSIQSNALAWQAELIVDGLDIPWGITMVNDSTMLITQKQGEVGVVEIPAKRYQTISRIKGVTSGGQGGLLDIARSPFQSGEFYFTYSKTTDSGVDTTLAKAKILNNQLSDWQDLLVTRSNSRTGRHFGSRITFDEQHVYFGIGDRGERENGQNTLTHSGSILRVNPDGSTPTDNPFVNNAKFQPQIWSYGHRNPQGLFFDQASQILWEIEHGPRGGDEINLIKKGANYGWPVTSHGKEYWGPLDVGEAKEKPGIESPRKVYIPSIAPGSLVMYRHTKYPELNGKLLTGALKLAHINVLTLDDDQNIITEQRILENLGERIRDIEVASDGNIYFSTDSGKIMRLVR
ncbi:PQQ-dependent sugar dehydrogenase [Vibrio sp.]|uniref:PQQ-dependent sugar dehydrogenase n=1 Tax=Vibrio sp. TaxID=678 RepID=UPI003D141BED